MMTELDFAQEKLRQYKLFLADYLKGAEEHGIPEPMQEVMINFMLDKIIEVRERIKRLESKN